MRKRKNEYIFILEIFLEINSRKATPHIKGNENNIICIIILIIKATINYWVKNYEYFLW